MNSQVARALRNMFGVKELSEIPHDLVSRVERANHLAFRAGGEIYSRQIVAAIVMQWEIDTKSIC